MNLNVTTTTALLAWPIVAIWLYKTLPVGRATLWTILGGYMLLPVRAEIKFAMIPQFDKDSIPTLVALAACIVVLRKPIRLWTRFGLAEVFILTLLLSPFITSQLNGDDVVSGGRMLPGVDTYDAGSAVIAQMIVLIPFLIGRQILRSEADTEDILRVLVLAGLAYSILMLFEVRMSPQLHTWVYGYFPSMFAQAFREGGFRPVVFMGHGLLVAFFAAMSIVAASAFWRTGTPIFRRYRVSAGGITAYLGIVLVLCKTLGALVYAVVLVPVVRFLKPKLQVKIAVVLTLFALLYPTLRAADLVPTGLMLQMAAAVDDDRADSLETRFTHEYRLLQRASQRFYFGWGRFGRSRIYNEYGGDDTLSDGLWIITMGQFGIIGFVAQFGLLSWPVFRAASALRRISSAKEAVFLSALTLILAISLVDLLPNSTLRPWTWLIAGALLGRAEALLAPAHRSNRSAPLTTRASAT